MLSPMSMKVRRSLRLVAACFCGLALSGCQTDNAGAPAAGTAAEEDKKSGVDVGALLSMTYVDAKKISPQSLEMPPFYKVTADEISVLKSDAAGRPSRARARGKVFVQIDFRDKLIALGQEAYIEANGEIIVRGKPLMKRGRSVVEGLSDTTVFYIRGTRLQVLGKHRLAKQQAPVIESPHGGVIRPSFDVRPSWRRSWKDGPNPLLPALSPDDVPADLRATPLLPPLPGSDLPSLLVPGEEPPATPSSEEGRSLGKRPKRQDDLR